MTIFDGLVLFLCVASLPALWEVSPWLARRFERRAAAALALTALGLNVLLTAHPWQAWLILALGVAASTLGARAWRWTLLLAIAVGGPFLLDPGIAASAGHRFFGPQRLQILLVVSGFVFAVLAGSVLVEQVLRRIRGLPGSVEEPAALSGEDGAVPAHAESGAPAGGRIIGMLERAFAYAGVLVGHPETAALVVAVKSVARYPEFKGKQGRRFAEYFLIGTLISLLVALGVAYLIRAALSDLQPG
ncbi:MAG: hypothetical protein ABR950_11255 [Candidatus Dormibacteria bacterium]